ncbi:DUF3817 domain-containing protein [Actinocorallia longicatena]|uniref:DUF3817 domain-containing protein n=1 Tax=Actinocorallia longicatena TaxID=111803 RepID=A0ABP6QMM7_9ACTN
MEAAVNRFRIIAYIVGVLLVLLTVGMIMKYTPIDDPTLAGIVAPIHGLFYMIYLAAGFDVWRRAGWEPKRMLLIALAGIVPGLTFFVEKRIVADARSAVPLQA